MSLKALRQAAGRDTGARSLVGFGDPVFDPAERARALAERGKETARVAVARGYGDFWQGAGIDRVRLAQALPSLLDTADELKAVAGRLGAAASDLHLGQDASETTVKRTALGDYKVVYFATHGLVAGDVAGVGEPALALTLPRSPSELDDGLLTASEAAQLKLNADWVVLSRPATPRRQTSPAPKRCRVSPVRSSTPGRGRSLSRIGRSTRRRRRGSPPRRSPTWRPTEGSPAPRRCARRCWRT